MKKRSLSDTRPVSEPKNQGTPESMLARHYAAQKKYARRCQEAGSPREKELAELLYEENRHAYLQAYRQLYGSNPFIEVTEHGR
ncbi:hypothetical protein [Exiguobacterium antarcticum]|uniref:Uncharacterized protein n=1 Tax=Exiguobacterium antarcticum TaxID=132920 RepID=A0ABT6R3G4_9BACL|nr:hypothetical protein [Exiguobacterium antarcticum]AFS69382.1 hypothetical protein Eab7_0220 [Exiguobacterium antarcticum B7]MDI3234824.1 hypothetical protein [Exiguobacterium antarcticum]